MLLLECDSLVLLKAEAGSSMGTLVMSPPWHYLCCSSGQNQLTVLMETNRATEYKNKVGIASYGTNRLNRLCVLQGSKVVLTGGW